MTCTCGNTKPHTIAKRTTSDGDHVYLWNDGVLTWALGRYIEGGMRPRNAEQTTKAMAVGWLVLGEVNLYDAEEVSELIAAARWSADRDAKPATVRARFKSQRDKASRPTPVWQVISADRSGKPTERAWIFSRMSPWYRCAVWDMKTSAGRYHLYNQVSDGRCADFSFAPSGHVFRNLDDLFAWLDDNPPVRIRTESAS
jgi:hypothetical protein